MPVKGQPIEDKIREILAFIRSTRITSFAGGKVSATPAGTTLSVPRRGAGEEISESPRSGPFLGYLKNTESGAPKPGVAIAGGSIVVNVTDGEEITTVTGLDTAIELKPDLWVWIEVSVDETLTATEYTIENGTEYPECVVFSDDEQTYARVAVGCVLEGSLPDFTPGFDTSLTIGEGEEATQAAYHWKQLLHTNLFMALMTVDGQAAIYPLAYSG